MYKFELDFVEITCHMCAIRKEEIRLKRYFR